ncbi:ABC transporter ATP-binding protein [Nocardioides sp. AX2bis]|uniref:ABC transporter ATP-binding protein n=1 Tax=Nocardioides sp. AX2bis TaxID=2653157 RepID=UPI0012F01959|nr:ABC transporter ATP-binding protein [Nocardioides sp. AX2bis]VXC55995.1 Fe(3+) ions import ATP-binding protein FbpC [Nocardioides sp. AX2bis]
MTGAQALALEEVDKRYGTVHAVRRLSLSLDAGEVLTVIGPSGCGKSTLLRLIAGLERPDAGRVLIDGEVAATERRSVPPEGRHVGLVFQDHALFPHLDVGRNVAFGLASLPRSQRAERVGEVLDLVGLAHLAGRHPHELSGGEQQRVALARAIAPRPAVVLLDEPFSSLDENLRAQVRADTLAALRETGSAAVVVTHDQDEALSLGDRLAVLRDGRVEQVASPREVYESPVNRFVATFMGEADFLPAHVHDALLTSEIGIVSTVPGWAHTDHDVEVVLRPHQVALRPDPGSSARVEGVEYHGAFVLHHVRLPSGRAVRSWQQHGVRHDPGTTVAVGVVPGSRPVLLSGDTALAGPPPEARR